MKHTNPPTGTASGNSKFEADRIRSDSMEPIRKRNDSKAKRFESAAAAEFHSQQSIASIIAAKHWDDE